MIYNALILYRNYSRRHEDILKMREKKFRKLLKYSYKHSKFYHEYYSDHGIKEDDINEIPIEKLPHIDKNIYTENFDDIVIDKRLNIKDLKEFINNNSNYDEKYLGMYNILHSSGSTGTPSLFVYDRRAWDYVLAAALRACKGEIRIRDVISKIGLKKFLTKGFKNINVLYIAATDGRFAGVMAASSGISGFGLNSMLLNINIPLNQWYDKVIEYKPMIIIGYPSAIKILCDILREKNTSFDVIRVVSCGEPLTRELRNYLEMTFNTDIVDLYGSSESLIIGLGRKDYDGLYMFDDINYVEAMGDNIYLTPLYNYTVPLIRYKLTDMAIRKERNSNEYLPFTKIETIVGRNEDIMWFVNDNGEKDFLHPLIIDGIDVNGIIKYQFVQHSQKDFDINIEVGDNTNFNDVSNQFNEKFTEILKEKNLGWVKYKINRVDNIPIDPNNGKCKLVIKEI